MSNNCPYCQKSFSTWKSVRGHVSNCKLNDRSYMICEYYGPILISTYNSYTSIESFKKDYPLVSFSAHHWKSLRENNKSDLKEYSYSKEDVIKNIKDYVSIHGNIPQARDFKNNPTVIGVKRITDLYGSWNKAIEAAGFQPNIQNGFGINTYAKDGILYDSRVEAYFVDHFLFEKEEYEYYTPYGNGWYFDFYLPRRNLYIEIDGNLHTEYRQRIKDKIDFCLKNNINLRVVPYLDVYKKDFKL